MSQLLITMGLKEFQPPPEAKKKKPGPKTNVKNERPHLQKYNEIRAEEALNRLRRVMKTCIMSTRDIADHLGLKRETVSEYLSSLAKDGIVQKVGMTRHGGDSCKQPVWVLME